MTSDNHLSLFIYNNLQMSTKKLSQHGSGDLISNEGAVVSQNKPSSIKASSEDEIHERYELYNNYIRIDWYTGTVNIYFYINPMSGRILTS